MQILRSISGRLLIVLSAFIISSGAGGQDSAALQEAFRMSYASETAGEYSKAIEVLRKVYQEDSYEVNLRLGWLNYLAGFFTESMAYYTNSINLRPLAIEARFGYVYPASAVGNWELVVTQYNEILKIDPQNTLANYRLGSIYYGREEYSTALKHFEKVVNLYPFDYNSLLMYAWTNLKLGKLREARVLFNKVLLSSPADVSALEGLSLIK